MSDKNKENSVVFSNKELKEVANTPTPSQPRPKKRASFIDDASSILSDIKSAIGDDVAEEMNRFEEERRSAAEAVLQREEALKEAQRAEIQARRAAEEARRVAAAEERAAMLDRLQKAESPQEEDVVVAAEASAPQPSAFTEPSPPAKKSKLPLVAGMVILVVFGVGFYAVTGGLKDTGVSGDQSKPPNHATTGTTSGTVPPAATAKPTTPAAAAVAPIAATADASTVTQKNPDAGVQSTAGKSEKTEANEGEKKASAPKKVKKAARKRKRSTKKARKARSKRRTKAKKKKRKKYDFDEDVD